MKSLQTRRLTVSAVMLALATVLAIVCALIPFLQLPMGGGFTIASMLPIVIVSYMYGIKWGFFVSFTYSVIQVVMDLALGAKASTLMALFMPSSEDYMGMGAAIAILIIDYFVAYTVLGIGGIFRNRVKSKMGALCLGVVLAIGFRYVAHIISGYIFYGAWAEWFFEEWFPKFGQSVMSVFSGKGLALFYSIFYNGLYMIPEIVITAIVSIPISQINYIKKQ